jgi:Pyruvate/2-oxoacid:ferredoxin oxidoreductase delta subunit
MKIDQEKCIGCKGCHPYCTVGAIGFVKINGKRKSDVDQEICVECGACLRSGICRQDAIFMPDLVWPRLVRAQFGNPYYHPKMKEGAQAPPELKINDITGRIPRGVTEVVVEMGRPGVSTSFLDVQKVCTAVNLAGVIVHPGSALATIMDDIDTAGLSREVLGERALNVMIHGRIDTSRLKGVLAALKLVAAEIDTVFSLSLANRLEEDLSAAALPIAGEAGFPIRPHAKINVGLGRRVEGEI